MHWLLAPALRLCAGPAVSHSACNQQPSCRMPSTASPHPRSATLGWPGCWTRAWAVPACAPRRAGPYPTCRWSSSRWAGVRFSRGQSRARARAVVAGAPAALTPVPPPPPHPLAPRPRPSPRAGRAADPRNRRLQLRRASVGGKPSLPAARGGMPALDARRAWQQRLVRARVRSQPARPTPPRARPQMASGERAWAGRTQVQVLYARTVRGQRLHAPAACPDGLKVRRRVLALAPPVQLAPAGAWPKRCPCEQRQPWSPLSQCRTTTKARRPIASSPPPAGPHGGLHGGRPQGPPQV